MTTTAELMAHIEQGTCACHDAWDQCPCTSGGHSAGCGCCPLGVGLCGPKPEPAARVAVPAGWDRQLMEWPS